MQVNINLKNRTDDETVNVDLQWNIRVTSPKPGRLPKLFRKYNRVNKTLRLNVEDIVVSKDIECNKENLFSVLFDGVRYTQDQFPLPVELTEMKTPFQLLFHKHEIKDCKKTQDENPRCCPINFTVSLNDDDGNTVDKSEEQIDVIFEPLGVKANFALELEEDDIQYSAALRKEKIGTFAAWIDEQFKFTPNQIASISMRLYRGKQEMPGIITFENNKSEITDLEIKPGRDKAKTFNVYLDFTNIMNPVDEKEDFTIETKIVSSASYSPQVRETKLQQKHLYLLKDLQGTELKKYVRLPQAEPILCERESDIPACQLRFVPRSRLMGQVQVTLSNIATDNSNPRAGLYIKNLTLIEEPVQNDIKVMGDNDVRLTSFVSLKGPDVDAMTKGGDGLFIPNGPNAQTIIDVTFDPSRIADLIGAPDYNFSIKSTLLFDYWEDKDGKGILTDATKKHGRVPITWQLHLEPNPQWLCVDYGSSAIVCLYDNSILNLQQQKDSIFRTAEDGKFMDDNIEKNTPFLSSDIVLHTVRDTDDSTLCSQQHPTTTVNPPYLNLSVCLSPTSSLIKNDVRTQLPCLKILVGNEFLPNKADFLTFQYKYKDDNGDTKPIEAQQAKALNLTTCILRIFTVFNEAYAALFRYFILPESKDKSINKLVLTYPNTYTPAHLKMLREIATKAFPKVRDGYLRFVSESDAVAAYYLQNWHRFNDGAGRKINSSETVLVYDMGAGTLDLTLFTKSYKNGKIEVDILGKIGTGKAGNYLDYIISEIIKEKLPDAIHGENIVSTDSVYDVQTLLKRLDVKETVKNSIKPELKTDNKLSFGSSQFNSSVILENEQFTSFLSQITEGIISKLLNYIGQPSLHIDTLIMSGRSCRLQPLQEALKAALEERGCDNIVKFDSSHDEEKTVVVTGAKIRAGVFSSTDSPVVIRSKRLYASYGLIYQQLGGKFKYTELLNSSELPFITDATKLETSMGPNVIVTDTAAAMNIKLIQTYLSAKETEKAYTEGDLEFVAEMEEYDMADFGGRNELNAQLQLDYRNNISLYVDGKISIGSTPRGVDLTSEITKRSIWPVTI